VRALGAALVSFRVYQSGAAQLPVEQRAYGNRFDARSTRWIKTEFALVYPAPAAATAFTVECAYVFPDRSAKRVVAQRVIPAGWTGSAHVQGIGSDSAGFWPVGRYAVSCWNNGERMAEAGFEVFDGGVPAASGVPLRFLAGSGADAAARDSFALGSFEAIRLEAVVPQRVAGDSTALDCTLSDPAGIGSGFRVPGELRERDRALLAAGPVGSPETLRRRGSYRVSCRVGAREVASAGFRVTGTPELPGLDARLLRAALFAGDSLPPGDEAVEDVVWSAARLRSLWVVAELERAPRGAAVLDYSCRITGPGPPPRNPVVATTGPLRLEIPAGTPGILLRQRFLPAARQRWMPGRHQLRCESGGIAFLTQAFDLTR
jgi:hypothetical protein